MVHHNERDNYFDDKYKYTQYDHEEMEISPVNYHYCDDNRMAFASVQTILKVMILILFFFVFLNLASKAYKKVRVCKR